MRRGHRSRLVRLPAPLTAHRQSWAAPHVSRNASLDCPSTFGCTADQGPRRPESTALYRVLQHHLETFLERAEAAGGLPAFVERELRAHLTCGILAHGFVRARCDACGHDRLVAFACKGRGFCPSCGGRRMADTAAWLRDAVLVGVPVRQWVLTLPWWLRRAVAFDNALSGAILRAFVQAVHRLLAARAGRPGGACGAVTVIQRFGGALNLNPHFHTLIPEGVYHQQTDGQVRFEAVIGPSRAEVEALLAEIVEAVRRMLERRGGPTDGSVTLEAMADASQRQLQLLGPAPGQPIDRERAALPGPPGEAWLSVAHEGFTLNAQVRVEADDPEGLERLCRYVARPAIAQDRLRLLEGDRIALELRRPWRDGTTELVFDPLDFIARLAAQVPAPRTNLVRYHGVFAPAARLRPLIVKTAEPEDERAISMGHARPTARRGRLRRRLTWAALMMRVFGTDVLRCPTCEGRMRVIAHIEEPEVVVRILRHLGLPTAAPPTARARPPPEQLDCWDD